MRPITLDDKQDMYEYSRDPETSRYLLWEPHPDAAFTKNHILQLLRQYRACTFFDWALIEKDSGKMIGTAGFTRIFGRQNKAEIGYVLSPAFHRQGLAPEAARAVISFGFENLNLDALLARIMEGNEASVKVAKRLGFHFLGWERESVRKRGETRRVALYELTKENYEKNCHDRP